VDRRAEAAVRAMASGSQHSRTIQKLSVNPLSANIHHEYGKDS
jgi:hypothetical protein